MQLRDLLFSHLDMIVLKENDKKDAFNFMEGGEKLGLRGRREDPPVLATRYFGRKSKTIPSRALKRRYVGPPKCSPSTKPPEGKLITNKHYFLPERTPTEPLTYPHIDVPLWKVKPVTSFYQMEGTENINDPVFERRHLKYELDERRRKRWDMQRLREQRASERKKKRSREEPPSFFPKPRHLESVEVTERLPVLAFGYSIPNFQPCDFFLPWRIT